MRRTVPALAALLLVAGLTSCGGSSDGGAGASARSSASPSATGSATSSPTPSAAAAGDATTGHALFASMTSAMTKERSATVTFTSSVSGQRFGGTGSFRYSAHDFAADMAVQVPGQGNLRVVLLPSAFYLRLPAGSGLPGGKRWLEIPLAADAGNPMGKAFAPLMQQLQQSFDPQSGLGLLKDSTTVQTLGHEKVGGVDTTKYVAHVDLAKAARSASGQLAQQYKTLARSGVTTLDYTVWVDAQHLPRKFATSLPTSQGDVTTTGTYRDWGKQVRITAPPRGQVAQLPSVTGGTTAG